MSPLFFAKIQYLEKKMYLIKKILYSNFFVYAVAMRERITFADRICRAKLQLKFITELATQDQKEREATVFELGNQKYNFSTYKTKCDQVIRQV